MAGKPTLPVERHLLSSAEARDPQVIIKLFERLKGRRATDEEIAELEREVTVINNTKR